MQAPHAVAGVDKQQLIADVRAALYCSKVCSYAQGMNIIKKKSDEKNWGVDLGGLARIWKVRGQHWSVFLLLRSIGGTRCAEWRVPLTPCCPQG